MVLRLSQATVGISSGVPPEALAEIADLIYFMRKRVMQSQIYEQELLTVLLRVELERLNQNQEAHLEREFEGGGP